MTQPDNGGIESDDAKGIGGQHDPGVQAGSPPPAGTNTDDAPASNDPDDTGHDDGDDEHDGDGDSAARKARREAAGLRKRLRETETERDELRGTLDQQQQAIIDRACSAARLTDRHIAAAQISVDTMLDAETGLLDADHLAQAIESAAKEFRVGRPPAPNPAQGHRSGHPGQQSASDAFVGAFKPKR